MLTSPASSSLTSPFAMRPPGLPDDYTPVEHLASGGQADVWRVSRRSDGTSWVAKLYHSAHPALLAEAVALSRLTHPAFPRVHGVSLTAGETHCLLIEHIPGETLDAWAATHRSTPTFATKATHVLTHLASALAAMHELDIAHRDLTPANVLLLPTFDEDPKRPGGLKLIDLGIATAVHEQTRAGTRPFRAPESFVRDAPVGDGARADVFAWGVLAVWLFSGRFPTGLAADATEEDLRARYRDDAPLSDGIASVPPRLRRTVQDALRSDPSNRLYGGTRLREALRAAEQPVTDVGPDERAGTVVGAGPASVEARELGAPPVRGDRPWRRVAAGAGLLAAGALAATAAVLLAGGRLRRPAPERPRAAEEVCADAASPVETRRTACETAIGRRLYLDVDRPQHLQTLMRLVERSNEDQAVLLAAEGVGACKYSPCPDGLGNAFELDLARLCRKRVGRSPPSGWAWGVATARHTSSGSTLRWEASAAKKSAGPDIQRGTCLFTRGLVAPVGEVHGYNAYVEVEVPKRGVGFMHVDVVAPLHRYMSSPPSASAAR